MKRTLCLLSLVAPLLATAPAEAAKFYKWTDAQGSTHYSADPPPASASKASEVRVRSRQADEPEAEQAEVTGEGAKPATAGKPAAAAKPAAKEAAAEGKDKNAAAAKGPEQYAEKCKQLRSNLQSMEEHARVKEADDKGEVRVLTDEEKNARLDATQRQIKAFCE
ncbi:MAG: hypothetical protein K0Q68_1328 [Moraxellaceae bacterium]|jgi:hypothetical protein|nr:hypothetical protein [Moraxellaceae bacterium]